MIQKLQAPVSVQLNFDHRARTTKPVKLTYDGNEHELVSVGFHHTYREGRTLYHVFSVSSQTTFFRIVLNTDNLSWTLQEVSDGEAN